MVEQETPARRTIPWQVLLLGLAGLALALLVGSQVIGVLYSIVAPPLPPLPEGVALLEHTGADYGVDEWLYGTPQSACDVVRFYENNGADCRLSNGGCSGMRAGETPSTEPQSVAQCEGEKRFSIFAMRWNVIVATGYQQNGPTHFRLTREVFWTGDIPPRQQLQP
ncbi:MAG: hypothetical protein HZC41_14360 [Chloroflexi bacterium]|nr:hypothetical protein [Chloroflexota bacterium]